MKTPCFWGADDHAMFWMIDERKSDSDPFKSQLHAYDRSQKIGPQTRYTQAMTQTFVSHLFHVL